MPYPTVMVGVFGLHSAVTLLPVGAVSRASDVKLCLAPRGSLQGAAVRVARAPGAESRPCCVQPAHPAPNQTPTLL